MNVNCDQARLKLQDLGEGRLPARAAAQIRAHLSSCAGCRREQSLLALVAAGLARLPNRAPSAAFDARVLSAAAAARRTNAPSRWSVWALNAAASATALWTGALAAFALAHFKAATAAALVHALRHPDALVHAAQMRLVTAGLSAPDVLRATRHAVSVIARIHFVPGSALTALPAQCAAAALIAGLFLFALTRPQPQFAVTRRIP